MRAFVMSDPDPFPKVLGGGLLLCYAIRIGKFSPSFISWLLDKGADLDMCDTQYLTPLRAAESPAIMDVLLKRGADPLLKLDDDMTTLQYHSWWLNTDCVERLLQEPSVIETIHAGDDWGQTAIHWTCRTEDPDVTPEKLFDVIHLLISAGADPNMVDHPHWRPGKTPLDHLLEIHPTSHVAIALLKHAMAFISPRGYYLTKARHIVADRRALKRATPSYLQPRMPPLPRVDLVTPPPSQDQEGERDEEQVETRMAVLRHVLDVDEDGAPGKGLLGELFTELIELMGPEKDFYFLEEDEEEEEEEEGEGGDDGEEEEEQEEEEEDDDDGGGVSRYSLRSSSGGASKYALRSSKRKMQG